VVARLEWSCIQCRHFNLPQRGDRRPVCLAYPRGIPFGILAGEIDHRKPQPGDNGIQYERVSTQEPKTEANP
jgi:hypothetical protein